MGDTYQGEFIGSGINRQQWYSICSGHSKRADGTYIRPDPECGQCMAGFYENVYGSRIGRVIYRLAPRVWRWWANRGRATVPNGS